MGVFSKVGEFLFGKKGSSEKSTSYSSTKNTEIKNIINLVLNLSWIPLYFIDTTIKVTIKTPKPNNKGIDKISFT